MDGKFLLRLEDTMRRVKQEILFNEDIRKLLYYENIEDINELKSPSLQACADHIFLQPIVDTDVTEPFNKLNYITITVPESASSSNKIHYIFRVMIMCDKRCWTYENDNIRPLQLAQLIINILDGKQFSCAAPLSFVKVVETVTNKTTYGYSLLFDLTDGIGDKDDTK